MGKSWKDKTWKEKKKAFKIGAVVCIVFIGLSFIQTPMYEKEDLTYKTIVLTKKPEFKESRNSKGSTSYWLELPTKSGIFEVRAIDYKYLKNYQFRNDVKKGDQLVLGVVDDKVLTITKNDVNYLQFERAQFHKQQNRLFTRWLFSSMLFFCILPILFKEKPKLKYNDGTYHDVNFATILIIGTILCFLLLLMTIGFTFISGSEFV